MVKQVYNDVTGTKRRVPSDVPTVFVPFILLGGALVRCQAAVFNSAKGAYWVHVDDNNRAWFDPSEVAWQRVLVFPDDPET